MGYNKVSIKSKTVCAGDLNKLIEIGSRSLEASNDGKPIHKFTVIKKVWAMLDTIGPYDRFDNIGLEPGSVSHIFYIRHIRNTPINGKHVIKFKGDYYNILKIINDNENDLLDIIYCGVKGSVTKGAVDW